MATVITIDEVNIEICLARFVVAFPEGGPPPRIFDRVREDYVFTGDFKPTVLVIGHSGIGFHPAAKHKSTVFFPVLE